MSIQYRLGIFGFMDFSFMNNDEYKFDSNIGLSDQIEALKWIRENINSFGGDKNNVTLMGESAGATSVLSLIASPKAKGLFQRAICQSPVPQSVLTNSYSRFWAKKALKLMSISSPAELFAINQESVIKATKEINKSFTDIMPGIWPFATVIDEDILPLSIIDAFKQGKENSIPLIIGTNKDEAANFVKEDSPWLPSNECHIDRMLKLNKLNIRDAIIKNYQSYPSLKALKELGRDMCFVAGNSIIANYNSKKKDTFVYKFEYETIITRKYNLGSFHGMEIMFVFNNLECELSRILMFEVENPKIVAYIMHKFWINFIINGNPNLSKVIVEWVKYSSDKKETLILNKEPRMQNEPDKKGYEIWKDVVLYGD